MTSIPFDNFPGLRLMPEQAQAPGSVTMLNADIAKDLTQVGTRAGLTRLGTGTASYHRIGGLTSSTVALFRNTGSVLSAESINTGTGTVTAASPTWGSASTRVTSTTLASVGLVIASRSGASNEQAKQQVGAVISALAVAGSPRYVGQTPTDQRYVSAHFTSAGGSPSGANGTTSTVFFSNPGDVVTWGSSNWVELDPDDGDGISGVVAWRELLFVVKRNAMYVFTTPSVDATGNPVFNYRKVNLPSRARHTTNLGGENIVAGGDGVYLLLGDGVYRTTGGVPTMVSAEITPVFDGTGDSSVLFPSSGDWTIGYAHNRVYLSYTVGGNQRTLVYDALLNEWLLWDVSVGAGVNPTNVIEWYDTNGLPTGYLAAGAKVFSFSSTGTSDDGTAITSSYQSGFTDFGQQGQKRLRQTHLWGTGSPTLSWFTDYGTADTLAAAVTLGVAPTNDEGRDRQARRGKLFSFKLNATTAWTVTRLVADVAAARDPSMVA